jgi:hypothetical protein
MNNIAPLASYIEDRNQYYHLKTKQIKTQIHFLKGESTWQYLNCLMEQSQLVMMRLGIELLVMTTYLPGITYDNLKKNIALAYLDGNISCETNDGTFPLIGGGLMKFSVTGDHYGISGFRLVTAEGVGDIYLNREQSFGKLFHEEISDINNKKDVMLDVALTACKEEAQFARYLIEILDELDKPFRGELHDEGALPSDSYV